MILIWFKQESFTIPDIDIKIETIPVTAKTRKLKTLWHPECFTLGKPLHQHLPVYGHCSWCGDFERECGGIEGHEDEHVCGHFDPSSQGPYGPGGCEVCLAFEEEE